MTTPVRLPCDTIVFASTQRTGSTALATTLSASNVTRQTYEWFGHGTFDKVIRHFMPEFHELPETKTDLQRYVQAIRDTDAASGLPVSLMLHMYQFDFLRDLGLTRLEELFGNCLYVYNYRGDVYYQAVSLHIAIQTQQWVSSQERRAEPRYDFEKIDGLVNWISQDCENWLTYFRENSIVPFYAAYERFAQNPRAATQLLLDWLGLPDQRIGTTPLQRQATQLNGEFYHRYLAECGTRRLSQNT
ncbi:Stf0 family sulfotransferase [Roseibium sp. FZY0029]|uniref:Stf0 family sulfotransferase n=1 Tax=Roseibium sp. FZY0029 TaxID=3116647 RepID=UPI002EC10B2F|nr:Stf0 family sulfotransferase [Roseibium sp. FZY0029]